MLPQEVLWHSPKAQNGTGQYARAAVARHARARKPECWIFELNGRGSIPDRHRPTNIVKKENTRITGSTLYPVSSARSARPLVLCGYFVRSIYLKVPSPVEFLLFLRIMHLCIKINLRHLERVVTQPALDLHKIKARPQPIRRRGFAQAVQVMLLANRALLAGSLDSAPVIVTAFADRRFAVTAIEAGTLRDRLELPQKNDSPACHCRS